MATNVADLMWKMLEKAGVKRCYGIVGDALNPVIDALRRNGNVDFVHVRHEEYGVFAAVADAYLTGSPVAVCGTAGPGVTHLVTAITLIEVNERYRLITTPGPFSGKTSTELISATAAWRTRLWLLCRLGCRGQRLSKE